MLVVKIILILLLVLLAVLLQFLKPSFDILSDFELKRRADTKQKVAVDRLERNQLVGYIRALSDIKSWFSAALAVILSVYFFGLWIGLIASLFIVILMVNIMQLNMSSKLSPKLEALLLKSIKKQQKILKFIIKPETRPYLYQLGSAFELQHLISKSGDSIATSDKNLVMNSLKLDHQRVKSIMTARNDIVTVDKNELLGPLVLDELHRTGHSKLPVVSGGIGHIIGVLHLESLLALDTKRSLTAQKAMEPRVHYINQSMTLHQALDKFMSTKRQLLIVRDDANKTVGLITLSDIMNQLLGEEDL